jgi:hypothetical protein
MEEFEEFKEDRNRTFNCLLKNGSTRKMENEIRWGALVVPNAGFLNSCNPSNFLNSFECHFFARDS